MTDRISLTSPVLEGNRLALGRLLTQIENDRPEGRVALKELFPHTGKAHTIGVTGAPGTGKSSLVNQLALFYRHPPQGQAPRRVGIIAVDPSSPFTGGAILGDRIRMRDLAGDPGVFIRSMASRGSLGGLAVTTAGLVDAFDAAGFDVILIETVGAGQGEVEIVHLAHTTLVVEAPGLGDEIQAIKAGILEIADVLVINKADQPGVEATERALRDVLQTAYPSFHGHQPHHFESAGRAGLKPEHLDAGSWRPALVRTVAVEGSGVPELASIIDQHKAYLLESGEWVLRDRLRLRSHLDNLLQAALMKRWHQEVPDRYYRGVLDRLERREISPWQAVEDLLNGDR